MVEGGDWVAVHWQLTATRDGKSFQESIIAIYRFELCFGVVTVCTHLARTCALGRTDNSSLKCEAAFWWPVHFASPLLILARIAHMGLATVPIVIGATGVDPTEPHLACHRRLCEARLTIRLRKEARGPASAKNEFAADSPVE